MANLLTAKSDDGFGENLAQLDALGLLANSWEAARDEYLGLDDFRRMLQKGASGDIKGALKSGLTGSLELGTSLIPGIGAAKLAKVPAGRAGRGLLRFFGAGAKTPARGVAINVAAPAAVMGAAGAVAPRLPLIGGILSRSAAPAARQLAAPYDPYAGVRSLSAGSPVTADNEALIRLMMQQGMI